MKITRVDIENLINRQLMMTEELTRSTSKILNAAINGDVEFVLEESNNRDRLINIINYIQDKITDSCDLFIRSSERNKDQINDILEKWQNSFNEKLNLIQIRDEQIIHLLNQNKELLTKQISLLHKNRTKIGGYNLSNVRK